MSKISPKVSIILTFRVDLLIMFINFVFTHENVDLNFKVACLSLRDNYETRSGTNYKCKQNYNFLSSSEQDILADKA